MVLESESFQRKYISRKTKNVIKVESPKAGIIEGNNFSSSGNANYAGYQSMRSTDIHLRMSLPKAACYKKITCETLMVDGFQANKLKRPTNRHLSTNFNKYKQTPLPWNCFTKSSLSSQEDKCGKLEEKNVNNQHQHQPLQRQQINSHPLQPSPLLSPSSSSSLSSSTLKSSIDLNKVESKATKKSSLVRNVKISNQKSCQNDKYLVDAEAFTALMKYGCYQKQEVIRYEQMNLTKCPIINSNEINRYLSFQSNQIYQITNLQNMTKLVYLNLSENQLISLNGLETLYSLRILLLGKNHIKHIDGLDNLYNLNVLDLNHNEIKTIENISHLTKLYYLNLSYNCITYVNGLSGLTSLIELNLKHNHIQCIESIENVPKLIWVFLSFNHIEKWSQISGLAHLNLFTQVTLDGNPIVSDRIYQKMVSNDKRFFKENTIVFPLRPYENESVNNLIIDDQCLFKTNVPISFLLDNKECFPVKQKLTTPTTIMDETLLNHLEKNEHQQQNESELGVNCRNNSTDSFTENLTELTNHSDLTSYHIKPNTYTYSQNESSNLLQSNLSILSTSSDLKSFSAKSTIDKMNEDEDDDWTNEVIDLNVETNSNDDDDDVNNYEEKNKTNYNSVGTLTNESILFPLKSSTRDNLLQFTYYLRRPTHLIIEGTLYTTVFNVTDDDKVHKMKAVDVIENVNNSTKKINELVKHEIIFDHFSLLIDDLQSYQSNNDDNNNTNMPENYMDDDDEEEEEERNYSPETLNLNCVVKLTVRNVNWNVFANYIHKLHELLPHLKELNLENNELKYLHQITDLIHFEHLTELNITGSDSNSIVEQAGHLWRSFIIWSLADALNLSFFNGELIKPNELNESKNLFNLFHERLQMRNSYCTILNQHFCKKFKTIHNISSMNNKNNFRNNTNISDNSLKLMNSTLLPTLLTNILNIHHNSSHINNSRYDKVMSTTSMTTTTTTTVTTTTTTTTTMLTKNELHNENEIIKNFSNDSIKCSPDHQLKISKNSKQNEINVHMNTTEFKQLENYEDELQSIEEKLSRQNQLLKDWPFILKQLIQQAIINDYHIANQ